MVAVFFDLDGVLADFVRGALNVHGRPDFPYRTVKWGLEHQLGIDEKEFWRPFGYEFWRSLYPYQDGMTLLRKVESLVGAKHIGLLTSPCDTDGCYDGKKAWVKEHLPQYSRRFYTGSEKELVAGPSKVLIDDRNENVHGWHKAGGQPVLVPRPWNGLEHQCDERGGFNVDELFKVTSANVRVAAIG